VLGFAGVTEKIVFGASHAEPPPALVPVPPVLLPPPPPDDPPLFGFVPEFDDSNWLGFSRPPGHPARTPTNHAKPHDHAATRGT
jgi:hypothetical protein